MLPIFSRGSSTPQNKREPKVKKKQQIKPKQGVQKYTELPIEPSNSVPNNTTKTAVKISTIMTFGTQYQFTSQNSMTSVQYLPQYSTAVLEKDTKKKNELHRAHEMHHSKNCSNLVNESNNGQKQYELALKYLHGKSAKHNLEQALELLLESAQLGNVEAMYEMGDCYLSGTGLNKMTRKQRNGLLWLQNVSILLLNYKWAICMQVGTVLKKIKKVHCIGLSWPLKQGMLVRNLWYLRNK